MPEAAPTAGSRSTKPRGGGTARGLPSAAEGSHRGITSRLWSSPEVAAYLCTTVRHVRRLVDEKRIPYVKVGHFVRFDPWEVERWIDGQRVTRADHT